MCVYIYIRSIFNLFFVSSFFVYNKKSRRLRSFDLGATGWRPSHRVVIRRSSGELGAWRRKRSIATRDAYLTSTWRDRVMETTTLYSVTPVIPSGLFRYDNFEYDVRVKINRLRIRSTVIGTFEKRNPITRLSFTGSQTDVRILNERTRFENFVTLLYRAVLP